MEQTHQIPDKMKAMNYGGFVAYVNKSMGVGPYFSSEIRRRIRRKLATNCGVVGEAGISKSYTAIFLAMLSDPNFTVDQIVFTYKEFMELLTGTTEKKPLRMGRSIVFDEPSYAMGKREWYQELNKALVKTIESLRFKVHPLFIPVINLNLLDKTVRRFLLQFVVHMTDRGRGNVYKVYADQWKDRLYRYELCGINLGILQKNQCSRDNCLDCRKMDECQTMRAQYERKKAETQDTRYERALDQASIVESREYTTKELSAFGWTIKDKIMNRKGERLDTVKLIVEMELEYGIKLSHFRAQIVRKMMESLHPELSDTDTK